MILAVLSRVAGFRMSTMKKNFVVVGEPEIVLSGASRNNALNEILKVYKGYCDRVVYVAPKEQDAQDHIWEGVEFFGVSKYSKNKRYILGERKKILREFQRRYLVDVDTYYQFRLPSLYSLQMYWILKKHIKRGRVSFYVAGDWKQSLLMNYPNKKLLRLLPVIQGLTIRGNRCVFTGHALMNKNEHLVSDAHAFYSTTHSRKEVVEPNSILSFERKAICFVGRLESIKNPMFMLDLASLDEFRDKYTFYIMGDGPLRERVEKVVSERRLANVKLLGHVSNRNEFYNIVNLCKYCVLPSYTEGTAKILPEMMSRGVLPIGFKGVGSNDYTLKDGGGLIDVDSVDQAASFIEKCDENYAFYKNKVGSAIQYALSHSVEEEMHSMFSFLYS